jgi:hypothetical protein
MADKRGDARNPGSVLGPNEYAGFVAPSRPDQSTIAQSGGYYGGSGGNQVDPARINRTQNELDKNQTQQKPLGQSHSNGF